MIQVGHELKEKKILNLKAFNLIRKTLSKLMRITAN
jgi:hypothetical protein